MDSRAQHAPLITTAPLSAAVLISPPSRPGEKRGLDFEAPLRPALRQGIIFRPFDDSYSTMPWALTELLAAKDISLARRTRTCAQLFPVRIGRRLRPRVVRRGACLEGLGSRHVQNMGMYPLYLVM